MEHLTQYQIEQLCAMQLSAEETQKLEEHLDLCSECTERYNQYFHGTVQKLSIDPKKYMINGQQFSCVVCKHNEFDYKPVLLNTRVMSLLNFDWLNSNAHCYNCVQCKYIHWFTYPIEELGDDPVLFDR